MNKIQVSSILIVLSIVSFWQSLALADAVGSTSPPENLAALWPMIGLAVANMVAYGTRRLSAEATWAHTALGSILLALIGAVITAITPVFQSGHVTGVALLWAAVGGATSFFATLNPSMPPKTTSNSTPPSNDPPPPPSPLKAASLFYPFFLSFVFLTAGCGTVAGQAFSKCELNLLPQEEQTVIANVVEIVMTGETGWQNKLEGLAISTGPAHLNCIVQAIAAAWTTRGAAMTPDRASALSRLNMYLAGHAPKACRDIVRS